MPLYPGNILTATAATVSASPTSTRAWQWLRNGTAIPAAVTSSYVVTDADIAALLSAQQTETNFLGSASAISLSTETVSTYSPSLLFAASEPGVWFDPSDLTTLYKESEGTTPVTAPGDVVGLMLDKSKGGQQTLPVTGWTVNSGDGVVTIVDNVITITGATTTTRVDLNSPGWQIGDYARVTVNASIGSAVGPTIYVGGGSANVILAGTSTYSAVIASSPLARVQVASGSATFTITARSRTPGNHATQATLASRPIYGVVPRGGRRNLEVQTQNFANAYWIKGGASLTATNVIAPDGTATACTLTGAGAGNVSVSAPSNIALGLFSQSWYVKAGTETKCEIWNAGGVSLARFDLAAVTATTTGGGGSFITSVGNGWFRIGAYSASYGGYTRLLLGYNAPTLTTSLNIWGVQVEAGSVATPYQKVTTQYDVTEAGVQSLSYLFFDGAGDSMVTSTITPGTDKAQVFAGARKLADGSRMLTEFSADAANNAGAFFFTAGTDTGVLGSQNGYTSLSRGSAAASVNQTAQVIAAAIDTAVLTVTHDIAGALSTIRRNAVAGSSATAVKGAGSFLAYPLYVGSRATGLAFSGQIFSLIVRFGANLASTTINSTEYWIGNKTGINISTTISPTIFARDDTAVLDRANSIIERRA